MRALTPLVVVAIALLCSVIVVTLVDGEPDGPVASDGPLLATASSGIANATAPPASISPDGQPTDSTPRLPAPGTASAIPTPPVELGDSVALRTETLVAQTWRDTAGTLRVHVVVSATNDTSDALSVGAADRTFRVINAEGGTILSGRFPYAFPFVVPPAGTTHLITTAVLPTGVDATTVRVEAEIFADIAPAVRPVLEVSDLRLVFSDGRPAVRGIVRNTGAEDVTFGVVAVIGRDASGRVIGGLYDNVNVASIRAGGEAMFQTEYPGLPPAAAERIADLIGIAFDAPPNLLSPTLMPSPSSPPSPTTTAIAAATSIPGPHLGTTEGCTAAFWAMPSNFDLWEEHRPEDLVGTLFSEPVEHSQLQLAEALHPTSTGDVRRMLISEAIAAILNSAHDSLEYPYARHDTGIEGRAPVVPTVAELLRTGSPQAMAAFARELAAANRLGCPLG
jgi:hypothetical protein